MMEKKKVAVATIKVATGFYAASKIASGAKESAGRLKSLVGLVSQEAPRPVNKEFKYRIFSPFLYQYGRIEKTGDDAVFIPEGSVANEQDIPASAELSYKGAWFVGDDFSDLLQDAFTEDQIGKMIQDGDLRKTLSFIGGVTIFVLCLIFLVFGKWFGLFSLPAAAMLIAFSLKNGVYSETLRQKRVINLKEYLSLKGFGWAWQ